MRIIPEKRKSFNEKALIDKVIKAVEKRGNKKKKFLKELSDSESDSDDDDDDDESDGESDAEKSTDDNDGDDDQADDGDAQDTNKALQSDLRKCFSKKALNLILKAERSGLSKHIKKKKSLLKQATLLMNQKINSYVDKNK